MKIWNYKLTLPILSLMFAGLAACGTNPRNEAAISNGQNSAVKTLSNQPASQTPELSPPVKPSEAVKARAAEISLSAGNTAEAEIEVIVANGYHINGNPASSALLRATELKIEPAAGLRLGKPVYPPTELKKFDFSDEQLAVYQGTTKIKLPIQAEKNIKTGLVTLRGTIQAQPCNDNACFPPRSIEFSLPVRITQ